MENEKMQVKVLPKQPLELLNFTKKMSYRYWSLIR